MAYVPLQPTNSTAPAAANEQGLIAATALPTAVSNGYLVGAMGDKFGRKVTISQAPRDLIKAVSTIITSSTSATSITNAGGTGVYCDMAEIWFTNTSTTSMLVTVSDGGAGTFYFYVPAGDMRGAALQVPLPQTTTNAAWTATCSAAITSLYVTAIYITNK